MCKTMAVERWVSLLTERGMHGCVVDGARDGHVRRRQAGGRPSVFRVGDGSFTLAAERIAGGEPIQYVLGKAYLTGWNWWLSFKALIPRPETEELVADAAAKLVAAGWDDPFVVDCVPRFRCMALALKRRFEKAEV